MANTSIEDTSGISVALRAALDRVDQFAGLARDWDGEGAEPVSVASAERAKQFVSQVEREANRRSLCWRSPFVAPTPDGEIDLSWDVQGYWAAVTITADRAGVGCSRQAPGDDPTYAVESWGDAIQVVLEALRAS